ncbi:MAG: hypothetical protein COY81_03960, partial [Candidatus Pacebacteria bacterium CG_4_10_14_0_8_um_filter_43_12]
EADDTRSSDGIPDQGKFDFGPDALGDHGSWVRVPGDPDYNTEDFYVMQYEAKYDCTGNDDGNTVVECETAGVCTAGSCDADTGLGLDYRDLASYSQANVVATANGAPLVHINQTQSAAACPAGTHLITNKEWLTIARNAELVSTNWTGGSVGSGCLFRGNSGETTCGYNGTDPEYGTSRNARAKFTLSNGSEVYDLSGNVWDWNADTIMGVDKPHNNTGAWVEWTVFDPPGVSTYGTLSY